MKFKALQQIPGQPTNWDEIKAIRLVPGVFPDRPAARERYDLLRAAADADGIIALEDVFALIRPMRNRADHRTSVQYDLRNWSNPRGHGNNDQDKGWLELGVWL